MRAAPLVLSHWDALEFVSVAVSTARDLTNYQIMGVRFMYDCYRKGQKGAVLNHDSRMNFQIQVSAFLNALQAHVTPKAPALIICSEELVVPWHYHLTNHGGYGVTLLTAARIKEILQGEIHSVIIGSAEDTKTIGEIKGVEFSVAVVDGLDELVSKAVVKQLKSLFKIGSTARNFLKNPDQKLFWTMLNWSNPGSVGKYAEFCMEDTDHLMHLRYPYGEWWQRLTWKFCDTFRVPSEEELESYKDSLQEWSEQHLQSHLFRFRPKNARKRKQAGDNSVRANFCIRGSNKPKLRSPKCERLSESLCDNVKVEPSAQKAADVNARGSLPGLKIETTVKRDEDETDMETAECEIKKENSSASNQPSYSNENDIFDLPLKMNFTQDDSKSLDSSQDTIIYDNEDHQMVCENSVLASLIDNANVPQANNDDSNFGVSYDHLDADSGENDILLSIINSEPKIV